MQSIWTLLQIAPTEDKKVIRQAYAKQLVLKNPEVDPEGFQELRAAYENALSRVVIEEKQPQLQHLPKALEPVYVDDPVKQPVYWDKFLQEKDAEGNTALHTLCGIQAFEEVKALLEQKVDLNVENKGRKTALTVAIEKGSLPLVRLLCEAGFDINQWDGYKHAPLYAAVLYPNEEILKYLLSHPHLKKDPEALRVAIITHQPRVVRLLVESGFEVSPHGVKEPPLVTAARLKNLEILDYLLEQGADLDQMDVQGNRAVTVAAERGFIEGVERLLQKSDNTISRALVVDAAMKYSHFPIVKMVLDKLDLSFVDQIATFAGICGQGYCHGFTSWIDDFCLHLETNTYNPATFSYSPVAIDSLPPLFQAIYNNNLEQFKGLLAEGADPHQILVNGLAALHAAIFLHRHSHFDVLLEQGVDINQTSTPYFLSPLFVAVNAQNKHAYRKLMGLAAKDLPTASHHTALFAAVYRNDLSVVQELLSRGSDLYQYAGDGFRTLVFAAVRYQHHEMLKFLLSCGLHPDKVSGEPGAPFCVNYYIPEQFPVTPLALAIKSHDEEMIQLLLQAGADPNRKANGIPPLHFAMLENTFFPASETAGYYQIIERSHAIIDLLIQQGANINAKSDDGRTFLSKAIWIGPTETVVHLIESGADIYLADDDGKLPIDQAKAAKRPLLVSYLEQALKIKAVLRQKSCTNQEMSI